MMYFAFNKSVDELQSILDAVKEGYGGLYHDGQVGDIRKDNNRSMSPIPENQKLGIPAPKERNENIGHKTSKT
jgi:hypothetical protein